MMKNRKLTSEERLKRLEDLREKDLLNNLNRYIEIQKRLEKLEKSLQDEE